MAATSALETVLEYQDAWTNGDFERAATFLATDFRFEGPLAEHSSAESFLAGLKNFAHMLRPGWHKIAAFGDSRSVLLLYDVVFHSGARLRIGDHLTLEDGRIKAETIVYDTGVLQREAAGARAAASA
jgi:SnoaL-like domain